MQYFKAEEELCFVCLHHQAFDSLEILQNMPQDRPRSVLYRSFLTCDDPRGVVECNRIRKSKTELPKMVDDDKLVKRAVREGGMSVSASKKEREERVYQGCADELNASCSVQLMEVSRGAQKLTRVIDSWSKGGGLDRKSKEVAKDLLKGALDLQESLEMLEKLQEASGFMAKMNKPTKERSGKGVERTKSERVVGDQKYKLEEFHRPRHSIDGASSWDCYDELREVIRDSFARQKLLPMPPNSGAEKASFGSRELDFSPDLPSTSSSQSSYEKRCFDRRQLLSSPDLPSTSSSQSSVFQSHEFSSFGSSLPKVQPLKPKAPNLIAKLMGLEEIIPSQPNKQMEKDRLSNQRRPAFEIDLPKAKKPPIVVENMDTKQRTLEEIIGAMQFKGLLKSSPFNESKQPVVSDFENEVDQYCEPIVIMKPQYALHSRTYPCEENSVNPKDMPTNWKRKEFTTEPTGQPKGAPNVAVKKNLRAEKTEVTKSTREGGSKQLTSSNDSGIRIMGKLSSNKTINPAKPRGQEKKEVIEKRVDKIQKIAPKTRKEEMKNVKFREAVKPHGLEKMTSVKLRKQETVPNISQKQVTQQKSTTSNLTLNHAAVSRNSRNNKYMKKTDKPERKSSVAIVENLGDNKAQIDLKSKKETDKTENEDEVSETLHLEEVSDVSQTLIIDDHSEAESLSCVSTVPTIHSESSSECKECDQHCVAPKSKPEANATKNLLLSNTSFLSHAEGLFDIYSWQPVELKPDSSHNETPETKLLLDCASELLESKKLQITLSVVDTLPKKPIRSQVHISLDKLVAEICCGIETLRSYKDLTATLSADTLFALVERDLQCNVAVSGGAWDLGWRKGFTYDEVEHVVADMEKLLLGGILEDALADFGWQ
ncbi:uncharacterized protein LOC116000363 isoform X2 [Ipomoea triloba]|uniref:uncharacterized protein LOC116000363 isoform X2 n=1 Tax=Ipomoea triloba TaxID=35885 RepID=UPI00125E924A|nr:uncharacterized protein LOC116000363 isoform X2 [Ipomoea triloba]